MRMLLTGVSGHLGGTIARRAAAAGWEVAGTYFSNPADPGEWLDIRDRAAVDDLVRRVEPAVVVHTAAGREDWPLIADGSAYVAWVEHRENKEADVMLARVDAEGQMKDAPVRINPEAGEATAWRGDPPQTTSAIP